MPCRRRQNLMYISRLKSSFSVTWRHLLRDSFTPESRSVARDAMLCSYIYCNMV